VIIIIGESQTFSTSTQRRKQAKNSPQRKNILKEKSGSRYGPSKVHQIRKDKEIALS